MRRRRLGRPDPFAPTDPGALPKRCAVRVQQGKRHPRIPETEPYTVCLSRTQYDKLFKGKRPKLLGCGSWACAYDVGGGRAVKIPADAEDVAAFRAVRKHPRVAKVFREFELAASGTDPKGHPKRVYALEMEKLATLPLKMQEWVRDALLVPFAAISGDAAPWVDMPGQFPGVKYGTAEYARGQCRRDKECERFVDDFLETYTALFRKGVWWRDFHAKNFGVTAAGKWKILDLGMSRQKLDPAPKLLTGARYRKLRRQR